MSHFWRTTWASRNSFRVRTVLVALIPAESINDSGLFLDDESFLALREQLPMPVYPSYDFVDVLSRERDPRLTGVAA